MQLLLSLSLISVLCSTTIANPLLGDGDDVNLFADSDAFPLFPDDLTGLPANYADSTLDQAPLADLDSDDTLGWTDSTELAGANDFCAADEEVQTTNRMRARDGASCRSSGQNTNLLNLNGLFDIFKKKTPPSVQPDSETQTSPPIGEPALPEENQCQDPYSHHLCCAQPGLNSLNIVDGVKFANTMETCTSGTYMIGSPYIHTVHFR